MKLRTSNLACLCLLALCALARAETVIHAGSLIDVERGTLVREQSVVVADGRIVRIADGYVAGEEIIDLTGATVMPGWLDMHVHIGSENSPNRQVETFTRDPADFAFRAAVYAERTLRKSG